MMKREPILIVDDDAMTRECIRQYLEFHGYDCVEAANGVEAIRRLLEEPCGVMITDNHMPVMNGIELIEYLHACPLHRPSLMILMSGDMDHEIKTRAARAGVQSCVEKPLHFPDLLREVSHAALEPTVCS